MPRSNARCKMAFASSRSRSTSPKLCHKPREMAGSFKPDLPTQNKASFHNVQHMLGKPFTNTSEFVSVFLSTIISLIYLFAQMLSLRIFHYMNGMIDFYVQIVEGGITLKDILRTRTYPFRQKIEKMDEERISENSRSPGRTRSLCKAVSSIFINSLFDFKILRFFKLEQRMLCTDT